MNFRVRVRAASAAAVWFAAFAERRFANSALEFFLSAAICSSVSCTFDFKAAVNTLSVKSWSSTASVREGSSPADESGVGLLAACGSWALELQA